MVNKHNNFTGNQEDIFQQLETPAQDIPFEDGCDLDIELELRGALSTALKLARRQGIGRDRIVDEMNRLLPELPKTKKITIRKINAWMAASKEDSEFPARFIPAFCAATRCDLPMREMAKTINMELSDPRELMAQEFGEIEIKRAVLAQKAKRLRSKLGS